MREKIRDFIKLRMNAMSPAFTFDQALDIIAGQLEDCLCYQEDGEALLDQFITAQSKTATEVIQEAENG